MFISRCNQQAPQGRLPALCRIVAGYRISALLPVEQHLRTVDQILVKHIGNTRCKLHAFGIAHGAAIGIEVTLQWHPDLIRGVADIGQLMQHAQSQRAFFKG